DRTEAIIRGMTPAERNNTRILNGSRRARIARGSGVTVTDVNQLVNRFEQAAKMMKKVARGENAGVPGMGAMPGQKPGASSKRGKKGKKGKYQGGQSGNPAKRAAQGTPAPSSQPTGSGFGLGAAQEEPEAPDMAEIQKL